MPGKYNLYLSGRKAFNPHSNKRHYSVKLPDMQELVGLEG